MKNKFKILKNLIFFLIILFNFNKASAEDITINAETVDIKQNGNLILADGSVNITDGIDLSITGNKAEYNKIKKILIITGSVIISDGSNLKITGNRAKYDKVREILEIDGNVLLNDFLNSYDIKSEKIIYYKSYKTITSIDETFINYNNEFKINTSNISFNKNTNIFQTKEQTKIEDNFNNNFDISTLEFDLKEKIFKGEEIILSDEEKNLLKIKNGYVDLKSNELIGSDFIFEFDQSFFGNSENEPRLVGRYIITNKLETNMKKSSFTTCKIVGDCPAWSVSADEVSHKKESKRIEYKKAWLKIYDKPVAYFPYFFHPDPTVKRQSGFLFPQFINNSNLGFSSQIPYFKVIDNDKDMTISPRIFADNNLFLQTEYRQAFENSNLITDFSYNKKNQSNSHFFSSMIGQIEDSFYEFQIQTVSNKDYLKKYQLQSPLIENYSLLSSSLLLERNNDEYSFSSSINVFEDLTKGENDRHEYILPNYEFSKETFLDKGLFDTFNFRSSGNVRKYDTNIDEIDQVNDFLFVSEKNNKFNNLNSEFNLLARNVNSYGDLSSSYKEDENYKFIGSALLNLKYPLIKSSISGNKYLTPLASVRYSPNKGVNLQNENVTLDFQDLLKLDRLNNKTVENGVAATLGLEYKDENSLNQEKLNLGMAINFRNKVDDNLPNSLSLGQKTSDIIGYSGINITENLSINYDFSLEHNLSDANYSLLSANYNGNKFKTSFEYLEKSNFVGDQSYLNNTTEYQINKFNSISFETNRNIDKNLTNYYNLIYEYQNDCLKASVVYNKQFYSDDTINSGKNIFFKLSLLPFGQIVSTSSPNLNE